MLDEIYTWLEEYAGTSYDFSESIKEIDGNRAFISPFDWRTSIGLIREQLDDAFDVIDEYWTMIPDTLPDRQEMKKILATVTIQAIVGNVRSVLSQMNLDIPPIETMDQLENIVITICELLDLLINHELSDILKNDLYETHEEENDNSFESLLNVYKADMTQLSFTVNAIRQSYFEKLDETEDMF